MKVRGDFLGPPSSTDKTTLRRKCDPVHKKGDQSLVTNYRPISLLNSVEFFLENLSLYICIIIYRLPLILTALLHVA